jgi:hypothetical protein
MPTLGAVACGVLISLVIRFDIRLIHTLIATGKQIAKAN